jgi:hypothetical protein
MFHNTRLQVHHIIWKRMSSSNQSGKKKANQALVLPDVRHPWEHSGFGEANEIICCLPADAVAGFEAGAPPTYNGDRPVVPFDKEDVIRMIPSGMQITRGRAVHVKAWDQQEMMMNYYACSMGRSVDPLLHHCKWVLQEGPRCHCVHTLTESFQSHTIYAVYEELADLREALGVDSKEMAYTGEVDNATLKAKLLTVFDVLQLLPVADDGCIKFRLKGSPHSCHIFCVNALARYLGPHFYHLCRSVTQRHMDELAVAVEQRQHRMGL